MEVECLSFLNEAKPNYERLWNFQREYLELLNRGEAKEAILFCEHEPVVTLGRRSVAENVLTNELPAFEIERGGDVTYHGPGQLVIYPILRLNGQNFPGGLHEYLRFLEKVVISSLTAFGLDAGRYGPTGVWIRRASGDVRKIASIGIAVRKWFTYHGIGLNVSTDLKEFEKIRPCNFEASIMTSLQAEGVHLTLSEMAERLSEEFQAQLEMIREDIQGSALVSGVSV